VLFGESGERHRTRLAAYLNRREVKIPILRTTDRLFESIATPSIRRRRRPSHSAHVFFDDIFAHPANGAAPLIVVSPSARPRQRPAPSSAPLPASEPPPP